MRDGIIPAEKINLPADIARFYAGNRRVDGAASGERAAYDGEVFPADHTLLHGFAEQGGGEHIFGDDDRPLVSASSRLMQRNGRISPFAR